MIVYAFYGLGKTIFVKNHPDIAEDMDEEFYLCGTDKTLEDYRAAVMTDADKRIKFVNCRIDTLDASLIDMVFIPTDMDFVIERLRIRGVNEHFISEMLSSGNLILNELRERFPNAIEVSKQEYISDYENLILERFGK